MQNAKVIDGLRHVYREIKITQEQVELYGNTALALDAHEELIRSGQVIHRQEKARRWAGVQQRMQQIRFAKAVWLHKRCDCGGEHCLIGLTIGKITDGICPFSYWWRRQQIAVYDGVDIKQWLEKFPRSAFVKPFSPLP